ncbi:MAG: sodium/proton-translocating pyrophosphatase, partial [Bacteroidetes bacterium]|nr:sodium/proton-translocating pyrophosphatase [Bacteroidota bacterium]
AKKYIEAGAHGGKGTDAHKATVVGDTVGDPFKDTSGPSLNILIKLTCLIGLVMAPILGDHSSLAPDPHEGHDHGSIMEQKNVIELEKEVAEVNELPELELNK